MERLVRDLLFLARADDPDRGAPHVTVDLDDIVLTEVDRDSRPTPSVPLLDPFTPRRATWFFDRYVLPRIYFRRILLGRV